jgi:hypothetical protein
LSLEETEKILLRIDLDRYINEREIFEAKNLARVVTYIEKRAKERELNLEVGPTPKNETTTVETFSIITL